MELIDARYARQVSLPQVGDEGQKKLKNARVLIAGAGGLGSPILLYLAAAGVGTIGIVDDDRVDITNLQRQVLYSERDVGKLKVEAAADRCKALNSQISVRAHCLRIDANNIKAVIEDYDLVVEATDNFSSKYVIADACLSEGKPLVWGSVFQFSGQTGLISSASMDACYRCLFPEAPPLELAGNCNDAGVFGAVCGVIGSLQAANVLKWIIGNRRNLKDIFWIHDVLAGSSTTLSVTKDDTCVACGSGIRPESFGDGYDSSLSLDLCESGVRNEISVQELRELLAQRSQPNDGLHLLDVRESWERATSCISPSIHVPLKNLAEYLSATNPLESGQTVAYCQSGIRSMEAVALLKSHNILARGLRGGMNEWERKPLGNP